MKIFSITISMGCQSSISPDICCFYKTLIFSIEIWDQSCHHVMLKKKTDKLKKTRTENKQSSSRLLSKCYFFQALTRKYLRASCFPQFDILFVLDLQIFCFDTYSILTVFTFYCLFQWQRSALEHFIVVGFSTIPGYECSNDTLVLNVV